MIAHIKGEINFCDKNYVIVDVSGVGYGVSIPSGGDYEMLSKGLPIQLHTYLNVTENGMDLFGFLTKAEKDLFLLLTSISSFGPKLALSILSAMKPADLAYAVTSGEKKLLKQIPGLGDKKAERLILELKDKDSLLQMLFKKADTLSVPKDSGDIIGGDYTSVIEVLQELGCSRSEAVTAVKKVVSACGDISTDEILARALKVLEG